MPVDPPAGAAALAAAMRALSAPPRPDAPGAGVAAAGLSGPAHTTVMAARVRDARTRLHRLAAAAPPGWHPDEWQRAAARMVVEGLLAEALGRARCADAQFQRLVDDVVDALRRSPTLAADLDAAVRRLGPEPPTV